MESLLSPFDKPCTVCNVEPDDNSIWVHGYIGILPVAFCGTCYSGIADMVRQLEESNEE